MQENWSIELVDVNRRRNINLVVWYWRNWSKILSIWSIDHHGIICWNYVLLWLFVWYNLENHHKQLTSTAGYIIGAVFPLPDYLSHWIYWQLEQKSRIYILHDSAWEKKIWETQATIRTNQTCGIKARKSSIDNEIWAYSDSNYICLYHSCKPLAGLFCYVWF